MSDWETLLLKCTNDLGYRAELAEALKNGQDDQIGTLLARIGVQGTGSGELAARVAALKATYGPMLALAEQLDPSVRMAP